MESIPIWLSNVLAFCLGYTLVSLFIFIVKAISYIARD